MHYSFRFLLAALAVWRVTHMLVREDGPWEILVRFRRGLRLQLEYQGGLSVNVAGPVTGKSYTFSGLQRVAKIDPRDAPALLRDRRFRLKGIVRAKDSN